MKLHILPAIVFAYLMGAGITLAQDDGQIAVPEGELNQLSEGEREQIAEIYRGNCIFNILGFCAQPVLTGESDTNLPAKVQGATQETAPDLAQSMTQTFMCEVSCGAIGVANASDCASLDSSQAILVCLIGTGTTHEQCLSACQGQ